MRIEDFDIDEYLKNESNIMVYENTIEVNILCQELYYLSRNNKIIQYYPNAYFTNKERRIELYDNKYIIYIVMAKLYYYLQFIYCVFFLVWNHINKIK